MPIRPENRDRYPADWPAISLRVREEAGNQCEKCGAPNGSLIRRGRDAEGRALWRPASATAYEDGFCAETGAEVPDTGEDTVGWGQCVKVVLTVAHLNHRPEDCARENLRAWCQRCHNAYDAPMRRAGIAERQRAKAALGDLLTTPTGAGRADG
jgi:hypothetical protein